MTQPIWAMLILKLCQNLEMGKDSEFLIFSWTTSVRTAITSTKRQMSISFAGTTKYNFSLKTFPDTYNPRADCFSTSYFQRCLQVMPIAVLAVLAVRRCTRCTRCTSCTSCTRPRQIISARRPCYLRRIASWTWSRSSDERDSTLVPWMWERQHCAGKIENKDSQSFPGLLCRPGF